MGRKPRDQATAEIDRTTPWRGLTALPEKHAAYCLESVFRESLADATEILDRELCSFLQRIATITFRPDAYAGRRLGKAIEFLECNGFRIIGHDLIPVSPLQVRELYRYAWNIATLDRIALFDLVTRQAPWWWVVLQDMTERPTVPASVRLRGIKGQVHPAKRSPSSLRSVCAAPNRILTIVHAADEPADIVRELGLFRTRGERLDWLTRIHSAYYNGSSADKPIAPTLEALYDQVPGHSFSLAASVREVAKVLRMEGLNRGLFELDRASTMPGRVHLPFRRWYHDIQDVEPHMNPWDIIVVGSELTKHDRDEGGARTIVRDGRQEWMNGQGRFELRPVGRA